MQKDHMSFCTIITYHQVSNLVVACIYILEQCLQVCATFLLWPNFVSPPSALALDKYAVSCGEGGEWEKMLMFPVEHGHPPQAASALSLFVISFPMAKDKGQRTYEEHAFLMWHPHQIHHSGLNWMTMMFYFSSNYRNTVQQGKCKLWRTV